MRAGIFFRLWAAKSCTKNGAVLESVIPKGIFPKDFESWTVPQLVSTVSVVVPGGSREVVPESCASWKAPHWYKVFLIGPAVRVDSIPKDSVQKDQELAERLFSMRCVQAPFSGSLEPQKAAPKSRFISSRPAVRMDFDLWKGWAIQVFPMVGPAVILGANDHERERKISLSRCFLVGTDSFRMRAANSESVVSKDQELAEKVFSTGCVQAPVLSRPAVRMDCKFGEFSLLI